MLFLTWLFRRASWPVRILMLAVIFIVFITTIARVLKATHAIQERNSSVYTRSTSH